MIEVITIYRTESLCIKKHVIVNPELDKTDDQVYYIFEFYSDVLGWRNIVMPASGDMRRLQAEFDNVRIKEQEMAPTIGNHFSIGLTD